MNGYNALAGYIGTYPTLAVFRKFLILNARNLLCMQGEIVNLEHGLRVTIEKDRNAEKSVRNEFECDISALKGPHEKPRDGFQWQRTLELRRLLRDYNEALLQFAALCRLAPANKADWSTLRELTEKADDSGEPFLVAHEFETWEEEHFRDLTSLAGHHADRDALSRFIDKMVRSVYHRYVGHKFHDPLSVVEAWGAAGKRRPVIYYPDGYISTTLDSLSTILASVLPTIAAFGIYLIKDPMTRMGAIVGCTLLFSTVLSLIARPKRAECFAASAAFAAVLVVFVGNSSGNSNGNTC
ncbi:uncharacterized protein Z519_11878 [Cladophialophora bantiana CBS 173.52]|uniref:DUF6594 domain-containing protein n=1 Tax=Cladophialophora bantiana (strain ATCC 10958 / CBS 173.52 / CDC B-1940 / NIH 8579) TaxID=1442370 RepID=A0A0D2HT17_CLAB1|nr:uncharacterized protein Z519_11878 [Cladophialophora bantiana CBS 173.52]KIW87554.1 hypothetical protein Z519_11878 [Cladophialophora bantiana CBS 173.52]